MSLFSHLKCSQCNKPYDPRRIQTYCRECNAPLLAEYNLEKARYDLDRDRFHYRPRGMWRWRELLPLYDRESLITLGEGDTPLLHLSRLGEKLNYPGIYAKDEGLNPSGSFKARGLSAAISKAKELGIKKVVIPTAGNAGGALAAYAARAGLKALIFMPVDTPRANILECKITGASVVLVQGLISEAALLAGEKAKLEGWYDISTFKEPYRTEGKKIMGYELAEAFSWTLPDVIIYPTGGGTGLVGMWKAFKEMQKMGWLESSKLPRFVAVQAEGCAPIIKAYTANENKCTFWENAHTIASGLKVPKSFADQLILQDIRESGGTAIDVSDEEIVLAQKHLAVTEGIFAAPEGAATLAAGEKLLKQGYFQSEEKVVLFITGTGIKYLDSLSPS